ncbi:S8 family serine peptidase [Spirosoma oryzicola]|uniref:S8 family serine peptidase n=1 Tax=Spirosoma oryzicola TaxID=2898794 RepID=UPI001E468E1A|nr:S8 family serine peptidase [Spirosoma oryzicola]UHG91044.1 S8 family serine peptidase [Spirosoma oryzicola]
MRQHLRPLAGLLFVLITSTLKAQPLPQYTIQQRANQQALQKTLTQFQTNNYQQALTLARRLNRPVEQRHPDGTVSVLRGITERGELLYDKTISVTRAGQTTRTDALYTGGSLGLSLSGSTLRDKLAIWDGGKIRNTHYEFRSGTSSRVTQVDNATTLDVHATHVAGIMMAAGVNTQVRGMAYGTNLRAYDFNSDLSEISTAAPNLLVSNHSYGAKAGWTYNDSRTTATKWEWYGDTTISKTEDYKFGLYDANAASWDRIAINSPNFLLVKAAGNDRGTNGPGAGQPYYLGSSNVLSTAPRNDQNGYELVSTYATAKNILTVSAVSYLANGYNQPSDISLADFSSWGPTDDGRIKPDIAGVGVSILSTSSASDSAYTTLSGTSMASPNVAGSVLLLQELFSQRNSGRFLRSSTLKGLVLHTADEAGSAPGPDYRFGWGLLNMEKAGRVILNADQSHLLDERTMNQGETYSLTVVASGRGPLVATTCWTDPAGTANTGLNNRTPKLVNDLDLRISDGQTTSQPWVLDPTNPATAATRGDNIRDNVEQVLVANPIPGKSYTITVSHKGTLSGSKQDYALLVSGIGGTAYCASAPTSTADTRISRVQFGAINQAGADGCTSYTDFTGVTTTVQAGQQLPLTVSLGTCGTTKNAIVKAFIDWNQNGSFDDAGETIATSNLISNTSQFVATIPISTSAQNGQILRLRIIASETDNAATVLPCGNYANGETQDYVLNVVQTANDLSTVALVSPQANFCGQTNTELIVSVRVRNLGTAVQRNVPVTVQITDASNTLITSLTNTIGQIGAFRDSVLTFQVPASTTLAAGQTYRFTITTNLSTDQYPANNVLTETRTTAPAPTNGIFSAVRCSNDAAISLRNTGGGVAFWYDAPVGGNLLAAGNQTTAPALPATGQFYATLNEFSAIVGPTDKRAFGGGSYSGNFGPAPLITTTVPVVLESARLYIASAGQLTFTVRRYDNTAISSVTLDVAPTRNQSLTATVNGQLVDDPNDQGAVYPLNLRIPASGEYQITIDYAGGASIFRSNTAVTGFPFQATTQSGTPIVSIKGALYNNGTSVDTVKNAWYYFYNLRVRSLDCPAVQRSPVTSTTATAATASITADGSTTVCQGNRVLLRAATGTDYTYQWLRNGQAISGATSSTLAATSTGNYSVRVANVCTPVQSAVIPVVIQTAQPPVITINSLTLTTNATSDVQWLINGVPIPGATNSTYAVVETGRYTVQGNVNGCGAAISGGVYLTILATEPVADDNTLAVYPNPASSQITISLSSAISLQQPPTLRLTDVRGLTLRTATLKRDGKGYSAELDVSDLPGGTFFVVVSDDKTQTNWVKRIRKQ